MAGYEKLYIPVFLRVSVEGKIKPVAVEWTDGRIFRIDKVIDERNAPPEHTGGVLTRKYRVTVNGREKILYLDKRTNVWFVEKPSCDYS